MGKRSASNARAKFCLFYCELNSAEQNVLFPNRTKKKQQQNKAMRRIKCNVAVQIEQIFRLSRVSKSIDRESNRYVCVCVCVTAFCLLFFLLALINRRKIIDKMNMQYGRN